MTIISATYNQIEKLKKLRRAIEPWNDEWILAIDGCDETKAWAKKQGIKYVYQRRNGRRYNEIVNRAAKEAKEAEILLISGDSVPASGYRAAIMEAYQEDRIICGIRVNVDEDMRIVSSDHRLMWYPELPLEPFKIMGDEPWVAQTSNGMLVSKKVWVKLGGFDTTYRDYGVVDQDFCMRAHFDAGAENWWAPKAILNHIHITDRANAKPDPFNYKLYEQRKADYRARV